MNVHKGSRSATVIAIFLCVSIWNLTVYARERALPGRLIFNNEMRYSAGESGSLCPLPEQEKYPSDAPEFFANHKPSLALKGCLYSPRTKTYTPFPFQGYSGETNIFAGTGDLGKIRKIVSHSGYEPLVVAGEQKAYAYVYFNRLTSSTVGDYFEFFTFYPVTKIGDKGTSKSFKSVNAISPVAALASAKKIYYYFDRAYLTADDAIRYGRTIMGFKKHKGDIYINDISDAQSSLVRKFKAYDQHGKLMLNTEVTEDPSGMNATVTDLLLPAVAANEGAQLPPPGPQKWLVVSKLEGGTEKDIRMTYFYNQQTLLFKTLPAIEVEQFKKGLGDSEVAVELKGMNFEPTAIIWSRDIIASLESPLWETK